MRFNLKKISITVILSVISLIVISGAVTASTKKSDNNLEPVTDYLSFAAAADPQFNKRINHPIVAFQNDIAGFLLNKLYNDETYKGLIIAGDLTERTYKWEILKLYNSLLANKENNLNPILEHSEDCLLYTSPSPRDS